MGSTQEGNCERRSLRVAFSRALEKPMGSEPLINSVADAQQEERNELPARTPDNEATPEYCYVRYQRTEPHCGRCGWVATAYGRRPEPGEPDMPEFTCLNKDCRHHWRMKNGQPETLEEVWVAGRE